MCLKKADPTERESEEEIGQTIAIIIRKKSEAGQLLFREEIFQELIARKVLKLDDRETSDTFEGILKKTMVINEDLRELFDNNGVPHYYSSQFMSEAYVRILLQKEGEPLPLIARIVRENSMQYPRPVPLDIFKNSPFEWTPGKILACLQKMADQEDYQDIAQTSTSIGTVFLYSSRHLDPDHASMLAEWLDVGQYNNP